ncbi:hypothetical protein [Streptomyces hokutonensis]|uniref:hypothetical protein n=1 Tax=Streptomyces hokutonensis TaxID=1306990 RepID=UPI00036A77D2|nr:hypothetical protein [Streptomyces hokutonensis]
MERRTLLRGLTLAVAAVLPLYGPTVVRAADSAVEAQCELNLATKPSKYTSIAADGSFGPETATRCAGAR